MATDPDETTLPAARRRGGFKIESTSLSDVGRSRTENQDACGEFEDDAGNRLLVVADGMGGHQGGATASRICVESLGRVFGSSNDPLDERLARGLEHANEQVFQTAEQDPSLEGMGTTAVAIAFTPAGNGYLAWVGDSRAYRFREGQLERLSDDHSLVAEWVRLGVISEAEAETHPRKNELLRSIGVRAGVEVEVRTVEVLPGDRYLLCSDGLCGEVPDREIGAVLGFVEPEAAAQQLIDKANALGGPDNITVQIAAISGGAATLGAAQPARVAKPTFPHPVRDRRPLIGRLVAAVATVAVVLAGLGWYALTRSGGEPPPEVAPDPPLRSRPFAPEVPLAEVPVAEVPVAEVPRAEAPPAAGPGAGGPGGKVSEPESRGGPSGATPDGSTLNAPSRRGEVAEEPFARPEAGTAVARVREPSPPTPAPSGPRSTPEPPSRAGRPPFAEGQAADPVPAPPDPKAPAPGSASALAASRPTDESAPPSPAVPPPTPPASERATSAAAPPPRIAQAQVVPGDRAGGLSQARPPEGDATDGEIQSFLESWSRSVETKDYALYAALGLPSDEQKFARLYGDKEGLELDFELIEYTRPSQGVLNLRLQMTYSHQDVGLARRINRERKVQVRETAEGLRYVGGWE